MKATYSRRHKTKSRIVVGVSQNKDEFDTSFRESLKALLDQTTSDSLPVVIACYCQWGENSGGRLFAWLDLGGCKKNVAYKPVIQFCYE